MLLMEEAVIQGYLHLILFPTVSRAVFVNEDR
jgi:hypothetical protein